MGSPKRRAIFDFGPKYLAIIFFKNGRIERWKN
jgi:hypothetical protein